jgi:hypothetical protein
VSTSAALAAAIVAVISLLHANTLQHENNQLQQAALNSRLEEAMVGVDQHFVTYARLRPFFFTTAKGEIMPPAESHLSYEAMATAELIIDFADDVASYLRTEMMKPSDAKRWAKIVRPYFSQSRITRLAWHYQYEAYDRVTACVLGAPPPEKTKPWNWETNTPKHTWRLPCTKNS